MPGWEDLSGKFALVANMLATLYAETEDRVVIVSNYTQARMTCNTRVWYHVKVGEASLPSADANAANRAFARP